MGLSGASKLESAVTVRPEHNTDVSVIIVTFNVRDVLLNCLETLPVAADRVTTEVLVVDNGSNDGTWESLASRDDVRVLRGAPSLGYAGANNLAWRQACGRHILFLNPDTELTRGVIDALVARLEAESMVGIVGPRLVLADGTLDPAGRRTVPTPLSAALRLLRIADLLSICHTQKYNLQESASEDLRVEAVSGACMLVRGETLRDLNGFDCGYFMYGEDLDLAARASSAGWRTVYSADVTVHHLKRRSSRQREFRSRFEFYRSMWRFYRQHRRSDSGILRLAVCAAIVFIGTGALLWRVLYRATGVLRRTASL